VDVLIAHRGEVPRKGLVTALKGRGYDLREVGDGNAALDFLLGAEGPRIALVDWDLPGIDGPELCRLVRDFHLEDPPYVILLAAGAHHAEVALGLESGANDCVRTPVAGDELRARLEMGRRLVEVPWGRAPADEVGRGESGDAAPPAGGRDLLRAFVDADSLSADDPLGGGPVRLDALLGDRWQTA